MALTSSSFEPKKKFLCVVTRCYKRPKQLEKNIASLLMQTDQDFDQVFLVDYEGKGLLWANQQFYRHAHKISGDYILILDDDDLLISPDVVSEIKKAALTRPEVIFFRFDCGKFGVLPEDQYWQKKPEYTHIGSSCFVVREDIWKRYIAHFGTETAGDFNFINAVWPHLNNVVWVDKIIGKVQKNGYGQPE